ncbi:hypothetical protein ZOD2009_14001 [Haladaptatus paucihalophilus DX253]|uniref:Uncharacterized protein n=1 Tax=Haladaptatus paucihalophilus DX253 TaxID=797209 RepID=E7QVG4_HALPU|nr:hypothetical protein ZOD2009_14001 [Haladaptatus paucihalophilus DX253]
MVTTILGDFEANVPTPDVSAEGSNERMPVGEESRNPLLCGPSL